MLLLHLYRLGYEGIKESSHVDLVRTNEHLPAGRSTGGDLRHIDEYGALWAAVTKIQSVYRAKQARKLMAIKREEYVVGCKSPPGKVAGRKARQYAALKRLQRNREDEAARMIQNVFELVKPEKNLPPEKSKHGTKRKSGLPALYKEYGVGN